jgi:hypothetical protein
MKQRRASQAKEWNIDPNSIAVMGSSAGAMISEFLAYSQDLGITACYALQQPHKSQFLTGFINKGDPPLVLFTKSGKNDKVHHPDNASFIKAQCDSIGVDCLLYGSKTSGLPQLPDNKSIEEIVLEVFLKQWEKNTNTILESH